ncbi:hypothetical protein PVAG01_03396 [Phlyctema vagabunda]|uniref:Up-regulated during septation protein 1 domain-containing protein n=1 Tax=Phlyctema vagabunda TaxID=108571 RepID=A0ABR4PLD6_9HELO
MAHIADFMVDSPSGSVGLNNLIARELSPDSSQHYHYSPNSSRTNLLLRSQSPMDQTHLPQFAETAPTTATSTPTEEKERYVWRMHQPVESRKFTLFPAAKDKAAATGAARKVSDPEPILTQPQTGDTKMAPRQKAKEQTLVRRRKVSVPELGPMTTVQEVAMDSPTIPGRPPLHERSISAPGNSWRQHMFGESMISCISGPALDENAEMLMEEEILDGYFHTRPASTSPRLPPLSPKVLAPLVIPKITSKQPRLRSRSSSNRLHIDSAGTPPDVPPKSARLTNVSPHPRSAVTPLSSTSTLVDTPVSAIDGRTSPKPWMQSQSACPSPIRHTRGQSETAQRVMHSALGHRRGESESSASIMDRGRPKKRSDGSPIKRTVSKRSKSSEQKAFETLPQGYRAAHAGKAIPQMEIDTLRKQAIGQACRFEVLNSKDVDDLSRELRALDERCEYLRKTHKSLRAGRRNLHDRICSYLRSPRVARFSHESILKQEEALSELDASIDDWVSKLEYAENRRTRVRQKLLEHVAAALILPPIEAAEPRPYSPSPSHLLSTPPRSPTKSQSPQRLAEPVKVSSPEPPCSRKDITSIASMASMASIKIYADSDVYALLADVEEEMTRMGDATATSTNQSGSPAEAQRQLEESPIITGQSSGNGSEGPMLSAMTFSALPQKTYRPVADFV